MYRKIVTLVIVSLLFSCDKENNETENHLNQNGSDAKMEVVNAQTYEKYQEALNFQNLNDFVGVIHNDILDELNVKNDNAQLANLSEDEVIAKIISDVSTKLNQKYANKGIDLGETPTVSQMKFIMSDAKNFYSNVIEQSTAFRSLETQKLSKKFFSTIANLSKEKDLNYNRIKTEIESFEREVMENSKLSKTEKDYILQATSIARNSFYYWGEETIFEKPNDPTISQKKGKGKGKGWGGWKWITVGLADVAGFYLGGGVVGSISASFTAYEKYTEHEQLTVPANNYKQLIDELDGENDFFQQAEETAPKASQPSTPPVVNPGRLIFKPYGDGFKVIGKTYEEDPAAYDPRNHKSIKELEKDTNGIRKTFDPKILEILKEIDNP
ncbi:hypothetical protein [Capnocytophaga sputigena]|uniref:hypothetical protein n=1 Tax=Capnocytophaga sputigena TaxID=1019 RepID=UPI0028D00782|nr:hypothetical protein [Capnocytophaga sputigena]